MTGSAACTCISALAANPACPQHGDGSVAAPVDSRQVEAALSAIYALRRAKDEASNGLTANARFIDQEVLVALGELERAFLPTEGTPIS